MRVHCLQHVSFEGLGSIAPWLAQHGCEVSTTRLDLGAPLPPLDELDWLIALGGPMSVNDEAAYPWLPSEKRLIGAAVRGNKIVLGICLGAQLIASALGASVQPNGQREIGWFPIQRTGDGARCELGRLLPPALEVFHWHGERLNLPNGAVHLARSAACDAQAFSYGDRVLGLQFHLETTPAAAAALIASCAGELSEGPYVQQPRAMLARPDRFTRINQVMAGVLDYLFHLPVENPSPNEPH